MEPIDTDAKLTQLTQAWLIDKKPRKLEVSSWDALAEAFDESNVDLSACYDGEVERDDFRHVMQRLIKDKDAQRKYHNYSSLSGIYQNRRSSSTIPKLSVASWDGLVGRYQEQGEDLNLQEDQTPTTTDTSPFKLKKKQRKFIEFPSRLRLKPLATAASVAFVGMLFAGLIYFNPIATQGIQDSVAAGIADSPLLPISAVEDQQPQLADSLPPTNSPFLNASAVSQPDQDVLTLYVQFHESVKERQAAGLVPYNKMLAGTRKLASTPEIHRVNAQ